MKKIQRLSLNELEETCTLLNDYAQASILGGKDIKIKGGFLQEINGGVQYTGDDGSTCFFSGVSLSTTSPSGTAYQYGGTIHIDEKWRSFDVNDFAHEYGHYIQEQEMGTLLILILLESQAHLMLCGEIFLIGWASVIRSILIAHMKWMLLKKEMII